MLLAASILSGLPLAHWQTDWWPTATTFHAHYRLDHCICPPPHHNTTREDAIKSLRQKQTPTSTAHYSMPCIELHTRWLVNTAPHPTLYRMEWGADTHHHKSPYQTPPWRSGRTSWAGKVCKTNTDRWKVSAGSKCPRLLGLRTPIKEQLQLYERFSCS